MRYKKFLNILIFIGIFIFPGCLSAPNPNHVILFSIKDLNIDTEVTRAEELKRHKEYVGNIVKISPKNGTSWEEWSKPVFLNLNEYSGQYLITINMSVWIDSPDSRSQTTPANFGWTMQNGELGFQRFGGAPVNAPTKRWVNLVCSQAVELAESGWRNIFLDGRNDEAGHNLGDLTLYIRHFKLSMEEI
jgi:hypothetical protein